MMEKEKIFKDGYPKEPGWYWCRVDGEEMWLKHFICQLSGRHEWAHKGGDYEYGEVFWSGEPH